MQPTLTLITGAGGHIGNVLARKLCRLGRATRAMLLPAEPRDSLAGLPIELMEADVLDPASLRRAFAGVTHVFHLAGLISILPGKQPRVQQVNTQGTLNVLRAAQDAGIQRLVYTSSIHALARLPHGQVVDEKADYDPNNPYGAYDRSKALATLRVQACARAGDLNAVIACPTGVIGPFDFRGSLMGNYITQALTGRTTPWVSGAYDFVDVRDVADGLLAAEQYGQASQSYILSGHQYSIPALLDAVLDATGQAFQRVRIPLALARLGAMFAPAYYQLTHTSPRFTPYAIEVLQSNSQISHAKASNCLGYTPRPLAETLRDTAAWMAQRAHGDVAFATPL